MQISDLHIVMSGGSTNTNPMLSLGGEISDHVDGRIISQVTTNPTNVTGVTIRNAYNNDVGYGALKYEPSTTTLSWQAPNSPQEYGTQITGDGTYVLGNVNGYLEVDVVTSNLPTNTAIDSDIGVSNKMTNVFDSISSQESLDGDTEYRCLYIKNIHSTDTAYGVTIWIRQQPVGPDELDIAADPAGVGDGHTSGVAIGPLADEEDSTNLLSSLSWVRPSASSSGINLGNLPPGKCVAFWERRTVPQDALQQVDNDTSIIGIKATL